MQRAFYEQCQAYALEIEAGANRRLVLALSAARSMKKLEHPWNEAPAPELPPAAQLGFVAPDVRAMWARHRPTMWGGAFILSWSTTQTAGPMGKAMAPTSLWRLRAGILFSGARVYWGPLTEAAYLNRFFDFAG